MSTRPPCGTPGGYRAHHRAGEPLCTPCRDAYNEYRRQWRAETRSQLAQHVTPGEDVGLTDGNWRFDPFRRVQVWVPNNPARVEPQPIAELVACLTCGAKVTEPCRTRKGNRSPDHPDRLVKRRCECGNELLPKSRYCPPCAADRQAQARRESDRKRAERRAQRRGQQVAA